MIIGLISDTHGLLRDEAIKALIQSELIIHAGDVGKPEIITALKATAPVVAIRGNIDTSRWAASLPSSETVQAGMHRIHIIHNLKDLDFDPVAQGIDIVISGHSHKPASSEIGGVLYINPGSAGPRRFRLPVTVARLDTRHKPAKVTFTNLLDYAKGGR
jgi:hypothetical protein